MGRRFNPGRARKPAKISDINILLPGKELMLRAIIVQHYFLSCQFITDFGVQGVIV